MVYDDSYDADEILMDTETEFEDVEEDDVRELDFAKDSEKISDLLSEMESPNELFELG